MGKISKQVEYTSLKDTTLQERNQITIKYEPLINKITKQMFDKNKGKVVWDDIKSMAYEGFVIAMNKYDPNRITTTGKPLTFTQFAAWSILNNIRTRLSDETRVVKMTSYMQKRAQEEGKSTFESKGFETKDEEGNDINRSKVFESLKNTLYSTPIWEDGNIEEYIYTKIEARFGETDSTLFYRFYGLKGYEDTKVMDMARELNVTSGRISQRIKKVVDYIKKDDELCEAIAKLFGLER